MGTYDIVLPVKKKPAFPPRCVVCEKETPTSSMDITIIGANTGSVAESAVDVVLDVGVGSPASRNTRTNIRGIPVCPGCENRLTWYHRLLKFATYTAWIPGLLLTLMIPGPIWLRVVLFLGVVISPAILSMIFPPAFGATILNGKATFEFKSRLISDEFRVLNGLPG